MKNALLGLSVAWIPSAALAGGGLDTNGVNAPETLGLLAVGLVAWVGQYAWKRRSK